MASLSMALSYDGNVQTEKKTRWHVHRQSMSALGPSSLVHCQAPSCGTHRYRELGQPICR